MEFVEKALKLVCERLNVAGVNYWLEGAIGAYIDAGLLLMRVHEDIDFLVEEKDVEKLPGVFAGTDFEFHDNRLTSDRVLNEYGYTDGEHEVYARYKDGDFHIGFFLLRLNGDTYTTIEYFRENGVQKKLERTLPMRFFWAQRNESPIDYCGTRLRTVRKETVYKNKLAMGREKDLFDVAKLKPRIEPEKLEKLSGMSKVRKTVVVDL